MAGLPNITAQAFTNFWSGASGALYLNKEIDHWGGGADGGVRYEFYFNASRCSSIYGSSSTVTPLSESCKFYIRY